MDSLRSEIDCLKIEKSDLENFKKKYYDLKSSKKGNIKESLRIEQLEFEKNYLQERILGLESIVQEQKVAMDGLER